MNEGTEKLIDRLVGSSGPVKPLPPPGRRASILLLAFAIVSAAVIAAFGNVTGLVHRYDGREHEMIAELAAMGSTALLAVIAAFQLSVPGSARSWAWAPMPTALAWIWLSGWGCYESLVRSGMDNWGRAADHDCFLFLIASGVVFSAPLFWQLSRARPLLPGAVAFLASLGSAAAAAFVLQFFHPFEVTLIDLGFHFGAVLLLLAVGALVRGPVLRTA